MQPATLEVLMSCASIREYPDIHVLVPAPADEEVAVLGVELY